jgi:hypothetical protein
MRTYIVLRSTANGDMHPVELTEANGAYQAIKRAREARIGDADGAAEESWHAVPVRNWTTVAVVTEIPAPTTTYTDAELPELPLREAPVQLTVDDAENAADADNGGDKATPVAA